jgi:hypothetical protein
MKLRLTALAVLVALASALVLTPFSVSAKPRTGNGTATLSDTAGNLLGTVTNLKAVYDEATNTTTISGRFTDAAGNVTNFSAPLLDASGSCQILHLEIGPVDLNLLGLMVHLDRVVLDITAQSGSGNLLGNLLCAVARLLDQNPLDAILADLTDLLNQIFRIL